ncbi:hypothetical protein HWV62_5185 [Athelia sp. TMB]|nr:hypothetical protein HWV62_5185 [Athelia sp. TMB]
MGARVAMEAFAADCSQNVLDRELERVGSVLASPAGEDIREETLTGVVFDHMARAMQESAPTLWDTLRGLASTAPNKKQKNSRKDPDKKLFAIYFKFKGLSAKGFDTIHALGLAMSHKWTGNAVARISSRCMDEVVELIDKFPWLISHDNVQIPFRVFSQRLDNQGEFGNGTAATVYIKRDATPLSETANPDLKAQRAAGLENPLTEYDVFQLSVESFPILQEHSAYHILRILLECPDFDLKSYKGRKDPSLSPPPPVDQLPSGPDHKTIQYLLGTVNIPEASYEDHDRLMEEWYRQLGWGSMDERMKIGLKKVVAWVGDQLTVNRLAGLFKFRAEDENSFERMDFAVFIFGWLHLQMAFANSLHKQYLGTNSGRGLKHAFTVLERKGLQKVKTQGPFFHHLDEALKHVAEAHLREDWLVVSGASTLAELRNRKPEELRNLASKIARTRASAEALEKHDRLPEDQKDQQERQVIQWNRDVLQYIVLDWNIRHGDVGIMEKMIPHLLFRFIGGKNSNYTVEALEVLQGMQRDWPDEVKDWIRRHCWLVNCSGKADTFGGVDKAQEANIKDIKVTRRSEGPNIDWAYLKKLHPAIHVIRAVTEHIEDEFGTFTRGTRHTAPKKEADVKLLQQAYRVARLHEHVDGRVLGGKDRAKDFATDGALKLVQGKILPRWIDGRTYRRGTRENWDVLQDVDYGFDSEDEENGGSGSDTVGNNQDSSIDDGGGAADGEGMVVD